MNTLKITEANINVSTVVSINDAYALNSFKNGSEDQYKQTIFATRPSEAKFLATKLEKSFETKKNTFYIKNKNNQNKNQNSNFKNRNQIISNQNNKGN